MKNVLIIFLFMLIVFSLSGAMASDFSKAIIFDVPHDAAVTRFGPDYGSALTPEEQAEIMSYQFSGDTLKILIILVDWWDRPETYSAETFDTVFLSRGLFPPGSVAEYFNEVSYGQMTVTGDIYGWHNLGFYSSGMNMEDIIASLDPYIDYSQFDGDGDGNADAVIFIHAGNGQEDTGDPNDIWSHALLYPEGYAPGPYDGKKFPRLCTAPETMPLRDSLNPTIFSGFRALNRISVAAHELSHNIGLPDLYDLDDKLDTMTYITPGDGNDHPVVDWCLMGYGGYGILSIGNIIPAHLHSWCKVHMGWIEPVVLDQAEYQDLVIYNIETTQFNSLYKIPIDDAAGEYFLLEYRNPGSSAMFDKFDSDFSVYFWPDLTYGADTLDRGLLITHVDDSLTESIWGLNLGLPLYDHYSVAVEDAGYDPAHDAWSNPEGHVTDSSQWWYPYETRKGALFSNDVPGQSEFGPDTYPNSDSYNGYTGIYVRVDSIVGDKLYAYVNTDGDGDGVPCFIDNCIDQPNPAQVDADADGNGDVCDNCPDDYNPDQIDSDGNGVGDVCEYVCGDANGDDGVNILDITYLINYLYKGGPAPDPEIAGDADGNDSINILDITYLINYLYKDGPDPIC